MSSTRISALDIDIEQLLRKHVTIDQLVKDATEASHKGDLEPLYIVSRSLFDGYGVHKNLTMGLQLMTDCAKKRVYECAKKSWSLL